MGSCIFSCVQTADALLHVVGLVGRLPRVPGLHGIIEFLPPIGGAWEVTCLQHCVRCNEHKGRVCDGIHSRSLLRFILGGLESVDVLEDYIAVDVAFLYFILQS